MRKQPHVYLLHILEAIESIERNVHGMTEKQYYASELARGFVERKFEIIGEATKRIPEDFKKEYPDIPWAKMAAMRNVMIHEYEDIDSTVVWDTLIQQLVPLKKQMQEIFEEISEENNV